MREMKESGVPPIGTIPNGWHISRLKYELSVNDSGLWGKDPHGGSSDKVVIRSTEQSIDGKWLIQKPAIRDLSELNYSKYRIEVNDLLITKSSGSADHIGKTTLADSYFESHECYFSNFLQRLRLRTMVAKYAWYLLNSPITRLQFVYLQNSTSGIGNINAENINSIQIPVPPVKEQGSIVQFLDARCAAFDSLAEALRTQIGLLERYKRSLITEAVTKGLKTDVPMKESGISWIGEIPKNWKLTRLKYICEVKTGPFGTQLSASEYADDGIPLINVKNIGRGFIIEKNLDRIPPNVKARLAEHILHQGDIVFGRKGDVDKHAIIDAKHEGWVQGSDCIRVRVKSKVNFQPQYLNYFFEIYGYGEYVINRAVGTTLATVNSDILNNSPVLMPDVDEQGEIVSYLDAKCAEIDALISSKQSQLASLAALKKSVIFDYVTGKKEVPAV